MIPVYGRKAHLRSKTLILAGRKDAVLSEWHRNWQYDQIDSNYGVEVGRDKTYEISILDSGERHIIDSLVDNLAIEFQHTLSVAVSEMDQRFLAHLNHKYKPYLILDFTAFEIPNEFRNSGKYDFNIVQSKIKQLKVNGLDLELWNRLLKWFSSLHFTHDHLFIDFKDGLVRFNNQLTNGCLIIAKDYFVSNLLLLEELIGNQIKIDIDEELRIKRENEEYEKGELQERLKQKQLDAEREKRKIELALAKNKEQKDSSR